MIKAVIFDLGRVIVPFDFQRGYAGIETFSGIPAAQVRQKITTTGLVPRFECGEIEPREFVRQIASRLDLEITYEQFSEIWCSIFMRDTLVPEELLMGLRERYRLLLLSNTNAIHFEMIREHYPLLRHFDSLILSYEVGAMKPSPLIYRRAIAEAGCRAEECFFTDDMAEFVEGARKEGIDAVQFQSASQIEAELKSRGVIW